jgi:hypothetical protein
MLIYEIRSRFVEIFQDIFIIAGQSEFFVSLYDFMIKDIEQHLEFFLLTQDIGNPCLKEICLQTFSIM